MAEARIVTDSSADLPADVIAELGIKVVPFQVRVGHDVYVDGPELRTRLRHLYEGMRALFAAGLQDVIADAPRRHHSRWKLDQDGRVLGRITAPASRAVSIPTCQFSFLRLMTASRTR